MDLKLLPNNAMTFTENQHGNAVLEKLRQQRELVRCCDVILHVNNKQFYAHRCVLSACSPFFDSLFKASKTVREQLNINADSSDVFHILLVYMYTGTVIVDKKNVAELLKLANKFILTKLKEYCAEYLQRYIDIHNCLTVLEMANKYGLESLQRTANSLISTHISEIISGEQILELPLLRLENFINNPDWCLSYEEILILITSWVHYKLESRECSFRSLLTWISWPNIQPESVIRIIQDHELFSASRKCTSFIMEVLDENNLLCQASYDKLRNLSIRVDENGGTDDENEKLMSLALSTAIGETLLNEPSVDKYLMDTGRELLRGDFPPSDHITFDPRDLPQSKTTCPDIHQYAYSCTPQNGSEGANLGDGVSFQANTYTSQNFEIEEFYKYNLENISKQKHSLVEGMTDDHILSAKVSGYDGHSQCTEPPNCYHYRDYKDTEHMGEKCPQMTNKVSYMNHKYDANYSSQIISTGDFSYQKNGISSVMFSPSFEPTSRKENPANLGLTSYPEGEYFVVPIKQEALSQESALNVSMKGQVLDAISSQADAHNALLDSIVTSNSFADLKSSSFAVSDVHAQLLDVGCSDNIPSPNSLPQDMSLSHLKLSEGNHFSSSHNGKNKHYFCFENGDEEMRNSHETSSSSPDQEELMGSQNNETLKSNVLLATPSQSKETQESSESQESNESIRNVKGAEAQPMKVSVESSQHEKIAVPRVKKKKGDDITCRRTTKKMQKAKENNSVDEGKSLMLKSPLKESRTCDICNTTFDQKKLYFTHMVTHFPGPPYHCDTCMSSFKRIYYLLDHRLTHSEKKPFQCSLCPFTSRRKFNLQEHMSLHTMDRPFKCDECGDTFRREEHLATHRTKHSDEKPFLCEKCGCAAKTRNILLCHSKTHTDGLYTCQYESCFYKTPKVSHMKEHLKIHTKSRPFTCEVCLSTFISKYHLRRHFRKHTSPRSYQCPYCDYCCSRQDGLKIHIQRRHSAKKPRVRNDREEPPKKKAPSTTPHPRKEILPSVPNEQAMFSTLHPSGCHLSPNSTLPPLSASLPQYPNTASPSSCSFETPRDPDDALVMTSEIEDDNHSLSSFHQGPYLAPSMGPTFSGLLDVPCGSGSRFAFSSNDDLYYEV